MPWKSKAQRGYMHVHHPKIAARWDEETPKGAKLPEHVKKKGGMKKEHRQAMIAGIKRGMMKTSCKPKRR